MEFSELARARRSIRQYQPGVTISDEDLRAIFAEVVLSPSSFNLQHWQFVIVRDSTRKQTLRGLAYGQAQVEQCAAAVVVCGRLDAHLDADRIYNSEPSATRDKYVPMITAVYRGAPQLAREEAIRSGALAAMSLMYAAKNRGWDCGPMIGFDAAKVATMLALGEQTVPVMLVVIGRAVVSGVGVRAYRRPLAEVVRLESLHGAALAD